MIRDNVPAQVQPDIKNLRQITKVWEVLDDEYGQERKKQKYLGCLEGKTEEPQTPTSKAGIKCFTCNKEGLIFQVA